MIRFIRVHKEGEHGTIVGTWRDAENFPAMFQKWDHIANRLGLRCTVDLVMFENSETPEGLALIDKLDQSYRGRAVFKTYDAPLGVGESLGKKECKECAPSSKCSKASSPGSRRTVRTRVISASAKTARSTRR